MSRGFEPAAFDVLYRRHGAAAFALARRMLRQARAEDAVQEAFLGLWRSARYDSRRGSVRTWLLSMWVVTRAGGGPDARAAVLIRNDQPRLVLTDIDRPRDGRIYQAWLVRPPSLPVPTGALFSVGGTGDTTIMLPALGGAVRVIVTSEPPRGSTFPTLPPVAAVRLPVHGQTPR